MIDFICWNVIAICLFNQNSYCGTWTTCVLIWYKNVRIFLWTYSKLVKLNAFQACKIQHVDFCSLTLWTFAHVQESPLDKIYVLLMIFIGPMAQSGGKMPRNLKESWFYLVVRMQRAIKIERSWWKSECFLTGRTEVACAMQLFVVSSLKYFFWGDILAQHIKQWCKDRVMSLSSNFPTISGRTWSGR